MLSPDFVAFVNPFDLERARERLAGTGLECESRLWVPIGEWYLGDRNRPEDWPITHDAPFRRRTRPTRR